MDITKIARVADANAIVTVTVLTELVQQNVFNNDTGRIKEVRSEQTVKAISITLVDADKGELLACGYANYSSGSGIADAASEVGKEIVKIVRK